MKKIMLILLAAGMTAAMAAGCGSNNESSTADIASEISSVSSDVSSEVSSLVSEPESGVESTASESTPSSQVSPVSSTVSKVLSSTTSSKPVSSAAPSSQSASKPPISSAASTSQPASSTTPQQICKAIANAYGDDYYPNGEMPEEYIYGRFAIDPSLVESMYGEMSMISVNPDQVIVMKAPSGKGAQLESAFQKERDKYVETEMIYPKDIAKLNASRVVRSGDYVAFIMLGAIDEVNGDISSAEAQKFAQDQIAIGVRALQNAAK